MESQTPKICAETIEPKNTMPMKNKEEKNLQNDPINLIKEAALFANSLNEKLKSLNEADAELFMKNFEKNVLLLPKNTKHASNPSNQLSTQISDDSVHDFVLLDSDDTAATANDQDNAPINQGMTLFGTSMKPSQIPKNELEWHFLTTKNENYKPQSSKTGKEEKGSDLVSPKNNSLSFESWYNERKDVNDGDSALNEISRSNPKQNVSSSISNMGSDVSIKEIKTSNITSIQVGFESEDSTSKIIGSPKAYDFNEKSKEENNQKSNMSQKFNEQLNDMKQNDLLKRTSPSKTQTENFNDQNLDWLQKTLYRMQNERKSRSTVTSTKEGLYHSTKCHHIQTTDATNQDISAERKNNQISDRYQRNLYSDAVKNDLNSESSLTLSDDSTPAQLVKNNQINTSDCMKEFGPISNRKPLSFSSNRHENLTTDKNVAENSTKEKLDYSYRQYIANSKKPDTPVSRPLELQSVQTQVSNVTQQQNDWLQNGSSRLQKSNKKSINILVLGQTGVGKSTWINAFANYLTYGTLEEAIAAEAPVCVIPTKFSLFDENYQRHDILLGNHSNEVFSDKGQSATQNAKTYLFEKDEYDIYIIDTPGMDDTRGSKQDDENIQKILRAVSPFKELHAICFLFKANESRLTPSFKYCISKLLGNLSKSALNNACFVFTNARGTFYKPGDTMGPLKTFFKELQMKDNLSVTINDSNTFCLDNEAFRFICAYFSKIQFGQPEIKTYADSWKHSSNEIIRLLNHAARLRPHSTSETLSINETRTWILQLVKPVIDVSGIIQTNLCKLEDQIHDLETTENNVEDLKKRAAIPITSLETVRLPEPQTVCTSPKCIDFEMIDGNLQQIYKTVCHKNCTLPHSDISQKHDPNLIHCSAFRGDKCTKCHCSITEHIRIFYEHKIITRHLEAQAIQNSLATEVDALKFKRKLIRNCQQMVDGYSKEMYFVLYAMANFSVFLTQNGISHKSDIFEKHLENLIEDEEKMLHQIPNSCNKKHIRMVSLLKLYQDTRQKLLNEKASTPISLIEIQDIRQKLFSMPLTGSKIAEIFDIHVDVDINEHAGNVTRCDTMSTIRQCYSWTKDTVSKLIGRHQK
uniref:G domain-containing protein n=1 Tax=Panagrolaimus sp. PS1159 TaxID=55785 RepID=A0AC35GX00_9BILA